MPAEAPAGPLASAWAVCSGLIQKAPLSRLSVAQALLSPLFESLLPADALPADAASCAPFGGVQAWDEAGDGEEATRFCAVLSKRPKPSGNGPSLSRMVKIPKKIIQAPKPQKSVVENGKSTVHSSTSCVARA